MRTQLLRAFFRVSSRVLAPPLPFRVTRTAGAASLGCSPFNIGRFSYYYKSQSYRLFSSKDSSDLSDTDTEGFDSSDESEKSYVNEISEDDSSDPIQSDHEIFEAFQSELTLDGDKEEKGAKVLHRQSHPDRLLQEGQLKDEQEKNPWNRKERVKACLDKLQRGPDGRYINVLEVASEVDMLIASYLKLRYQDNPSLDENSDQDEKLLEGIDLKKFKRLSKRMRDGTYEFQPIVKVPLPKRKIVKKKKKKVKKQHPF